MQLQIIIDLDLQIKYFKRLIFLPFSGLFFFATEDIDQSRSCSKSSCGVFCIEKLDFLENEFDANGLFNFLNVLFFTFFKIWVFYGINIKR